MSEIPLEGLETILNEKRRDLMRKAGGVYAADQFTDLGTAEEREQMENAIQSRVKPIDDKIGFIDEIADRLEQEYGITLNIMGRRRQTTSQPIPSETTSQEPT